MLYVVDGSGELHAPTGVSRFAAGDPAWYSGTEKLRVRNAGAAEMTLIAFLAPKFATS